MKTLMNVIFAGALLASTYTANAYDQWAEERLKAKIGRYSPAREAQRARVHEAQGCQAPCCRHHALGRHQQVAKSNGALLPQAEAWQRAKLGRSLRPASEPEAAIATNTHIAACPTCARTSCCSD